MRLTERITLNFVSISIRCKFRSIKNIESGWFDSSRILSLWFEWAANIFCPSLEMTQTYMSDSLHYSSRLCVLPYWGLEEEYAHPALPLRVTQVPCWPQLRGVQVLLPISVNVSYFETFELRSRALSIKLTCTFPAWRYVPDFAITSCDAAFGVVRTFNVCAQLRLLHS